MKFVPLFSAVLIVGCATTLAPSSLAQEPPVEAYRHVDPAAPRLALKGHAPLVEIGDVNSGNVEAAAAKLKKHWEHGDRTLFLRINSNGGSVFAGLDFIQSVEELKKQGASLTCIVDTRAISMGFVILQAVCDVRLATPRSLFLAHNGHVSTEGGTVDDLEETVALLSVINEAMAIICAEKIGMSLAEYKFRLHDKKSWTMGALEAVRENVIDRLISPMDVPRLDEE